MRAGLAARVEVERDRSWWVAAALQDGDFALPDGVRRGAHPQAKTCWRRGFCCRIRAQYEHDGAASHSGELESPELGDGNGADLRQHHGAAGAGTQTLLGTPQALMVVLGLGEEDALQIDACGLQCRCVRLLILTGEPGDSF